MRPTMPDVEPDMAADPRKFIRLLMENERRIYAYIYSLIGNRADAEDILQETSIVLWDKFSSFDQQSGNFIAWSFRVAYLTTQNFRRKQGRSKVFFSSNLSDAIAEKTSTMVRELDRRHDHLANCIKRLTPSDQELLNLRYDLDASVESVAKKSGRTIQAIYKALSRTRAVLSDCVNRSMSLENNS